MKKIFLIFLLIPQINLPFSGTSYTVYNTRKFDALPQTPLPLQLKRNISVMDDQVTGDKEDQINLHFRYGIPSDFTTTTLNNGTVTSSQSMAVISSTATSGRSASLQSKRNLIYVPGHEAYAIFDAEFTTAVAGTTQYIGLTDATPTSSGNGFALGYSNLGGNSTTFGILIFNNSSTPSVITQSNFNMDLLDGTGLSSIDLDPTKLNIYKITYSWATSTITFEILRTDGIWFPFHQIRNPNTLTTPQIANPFLPILATVANGAIATNITLQTSMWLTGNIAPRQANYTRTFSATSGSKSASGGNTAVLLSLQNQTTFGGVSNRVEARITLVAAASTGASNTILRYRLIKSGTLTGAAFASVNTNSAVFLDTSATAISGGTINLISVAAGDDNISVSLTREDLYVSILPGETITLTAQPSTGGNINIEGSIAWQELF